MSALGPQSRDLKSASEDLFQPLTNLEFLAERQ